MIYTYTKENDNEKNIYWIKSSIFCLSIYSKGISHD